MPTRRDIARFLPALPFVAVAGPARGQVLFAGHAPEGVMPPEALARAVWRGEELVAHYRGPYRLHMDGTESCRVLSPASLELGYNGELYLMAEQTAGPSSSGRMGAVKAFRYDRFAMLAKTGHRSARGTTEGEPQGYIQRVIAQRIS